MDLRVLIMLHFETRVYHLIPTAQYKRWGSAFPVAIKIPLRLVSLSMLTSYNEEPLDLQPSVDIPSEIYVHAQCSDQPPYQLTALICSDQPSYQLTTRICSLPILISKKDRLKYE